MTGFKKCSGCQTEKPVSEFHRNRVMADGLANQCRVCTAASKKKWSKSERGIATQKRYAHTEVALRNQRKCALRKKYGMSIEDYDRMLAAQGGVCGICQKPSKRKNGLFDVDHDHRTGRVRGLLCHGCNTLLALAGDSAEVLRRTAAFLRGEELPPLTHCLRD
jgi:Recombination endonuclease VII